MNRYYKIYSPPRIVQILHVSKSTELIRSIGPQDIHMSVEEREREPRPWSSPPEHNNGIARWHPDILCDDRNQRTNEWIPHGTNRTSG